MHQAWETKNAWRHGIQRKSVARTVKPRRGTPQVYYSPKSSVVIRQKTPATCECPVDHSQAAARTKTKSGRTKGSQKSVSQDEDPPEAPGATKEKDSASGKQDKGSKETPAKTCGKCKKLKKAPQGKKIAYRRNTRKYVYVHKDAPDEDEPPEEEDDEEPLPTGDIERKPDVAITVEATEPAITNEQRDHPDNAERTQPADNGGDTIPTETNELDASLSKIVEIPKEPTSDTQEVPNQRPVRPAAQENAEATKGAPLVGATEATTATTLEQLTQETAVATQSAALAGETETTTASTQEQQTQAESQIGIQQSSLNAAMPPTPHESHVPTGTDVESRKRQNESEHEAPAPKKARVDIDLTIDDDDDAVVIKSERTDVSESRTSKQEDADDMEHELEQLELEQRILEVKKRKADIKRKLAMSRASSRTMTRVKNENIIKIED